MKYLIRGVDARGPCFYIGEGRWSDRPENAILHPVNLIPGTLGELKHGQFVQDRQVWRIRAEAAPFGQRVQHAYWRFLRVRHEMRSAEWTLWGIEPRSNAAAFVGGVIAFFDRTI